MIRSIPLVDLASSSATAELGAALSSIGFVELANHGVPAAVAAGLRAQCDLFFALPTDQKQHWIHPSAEANRGFRTKGSEALSYSLGQPSPPDLFESFNCGSDHRAASGTDSPLIQPTPWPTTAVPGFAAAAHGWILEMERLSADLDEMIGMLLETDLAAQSQAGPDTMACIDYRPGPDGREESVPGQQRMGAHSDYTSFTILAADPVPGLQIVDGDGGWLDVVPQPGNLLMNVGDVLAILTNDVWPSTLHRVIPMDAGSAPVRRSVAYFHYPDLDVSIEPLGRFVTNARPARYAPATVEQHLLGKLTAPKNAERPTSASTAGNRLDR